MEYALRVIEAGKPVYIEKPMALNYSECEIINNAAAKKGVPVFVAYYRRTLPGFLTIKDIIDSGSIGKVLFVKIELFKYPSREEQEGNLPWRVIPEISGGGHFFDLACHQLDYLDYVFGPVQEVKSVVKSQAGLYNAEDFVSAEFVFPGNVVASGIWSFAVSPESSRDSLEIIGTKGSINSSTFSFEPITLRTSRGIQTFTNERPENVQYYLISSIVRSILTKSASPSTGETAARTSRVMDEVVKDYYRNLQ
jgi:predicted dehydrogenase